MLLDDRPAYPMGFLFRLRFTGRVERPRLENALASACARHPLSRALVRARGRRLEWMPIEKPAIPLRWLAQEPAERLPAAGHLDLHTENGVRVWAIRGARTADLVFQFHHTCCDAIGGVRFIEDVLIAYANAGAELATRVPPPPVDDEQLLRRAHFGLSIRDWLGRVPMLLAGLVGVWRFFAWSPVPLLPHETSGATLPGDYPATAVHHFSGEETSQILAAAKRAASTLNDLLLRDFFLALGRWRTRHDRVDRDERIRISVPMNLRTADVARIPATNVVSMTFLDRHPRALGNPGALLRGIQREMNFTKRERLDLLFVTTVRVVVRWLPALIRRIVFAEQCRATAVLSNVGVVLADSPLPKRNDLVVLGDLVLEALECYGPN